MINPNCIELIGYVYISGLDITNLDGLSNLQSIGGNLDIVDNSQLNECCIIPNLVAITTGIITIENNTNSCNSVTEIEACVEPDCPTGD